MERCKDCKLCEVSKIPCDPKGSENPMIYFVGEAPGPQEDESGVPFIGPAGKYLHNLINQYGLNENNCRFWNLVRCFPRNEKGFRAPDEEEINACNHYLIDDILKTNPRVIVTLGSVPSRFFVGKEFSTITKIQGNVYYREINGKEFAVAPVFHPSYLMRRRDESLDKEFLNNIKRVIDICSKGCEEVRKESEFKVNNVICKSYQDFDKFCKEFIDNKEVVAYDIETNAEEKTSSMLEICGFSLAGDSKNSCYVIIDSLDYKMPEKDVKIVYARLRKILLNKRVINYNCMYELPCTLNNLNIEIPKIDDVFVMVKLLLGQADRYTGNNGLKNRAHQDLGYNDWSEDLDKYFDYTINFSEENEEKLKELISEYYENSEEIFNIVKDCVLSGRLYNSSGFVSYANVPHKIIGKYGGIDSAVLFEMRDYYKNKMDKISEELGIDLNKGYEVFMQHHYAGYRLEVNGAYWNEDAAKSVENWCKENMKKSLRDIIENPKTSIIIRKNLIKDFYVYVIKNYLPQIIGRFGSVKRMFKLKASVEINSNISPNRIFDLACESGTEIKKGNIISVDVNNIKVIGKDFFKENESLFENWYKDVISNDLSNDLSIDEMKKYFNPTSTSKTTRDGVTEILVTDDIRYAKAYKEIKEMFDEPNFSMEIYSGNDRHLLNLVEKVESNPKLQRKDKLRLFCKFISSMKGSISSRYIKSKLDMSINYSLQSMDDDSILELFDLFEMCGIDIEDEETWTDEFKWLYSFRIYKKCNKILTTYINGKVGRSSVWLVDRKSYENGDSITQREKRISDVDKIPEDKMTILQPVFSVNMANTGRWKAGFHTLPAGELVKGIYTSRFKGGIIAMPDCSQAEVRVLATQCGDENLLNAFKEGLDIHKYVASMIFHEGDQDKVTSTERKVAKGAVFGILYGESERSFAESFCHGDMSEAKRIFNYFFTAFPKIKNYVEESHDQFRRTGKVTLMTDRFIDLSTISVNTKDSDRALRQSQNFRIQGATCDMAGLILYEICKFVERNRYKSKPFCFIHDSIEIDIHPDETFRMLDELKPLFNEYLYKEYGVPMASDIVFSTSMGSEIELKSLDVMDDDYNEVYITIDGYRDDIVAVENTWKSIYKIVDLVEEEDGDKEYIPRKSLFMKKSPVHMEVGVYRDTCKRKYHVVRN